MFTFVFVQNLNMFIINFKNNPRGRRCVPGVTVYLIWGGFILPQPQKPESLW